MKYRSPLETREILIDYLSSNGNEGISLTRASLIMETKHMQAYALLDLMQKEGLIDIKKDEDRHWVRGVVTITAKGKKVGKKLRELNEMLSKRPPCIPDWI